MNGQAVLEAAILGPAQESGWDQGRWVINLMLHFSLQLNKYVHHEQFFISGGFCFDCFVCFCILFCSFFFSSFSH